VDALSSALKDLIADSSLRVKLTSEKNRHLEHFQPEIVAKRYLEVFESALRR